ncbi:hypothetical protein BGZ95_005757 [Linnemannia exigua]|uniref:Uncharacterized protein n=1 Tax=Linnemannia exigua TaxID=604196 RepID=A0AAD4H1E2_9FUNG|nr:hypothetical protein BGZ95_005757 [Linnemannia exigua]
MVSSKTRGELAAVILAPTATPNTSSGTTTIPTTVDAGAGKSEVATVAPAATYTYSFAPMMPASVLTTYMLALTQDLGAICSAGTKKMNRLRAVEPLLWHRGPNTNPVYGLVVRMEYARTMFGEDMTSRWFRPALYWNGKNSPEGPPAATGTGSSSASAGAAPAIPSKALHREGQFWQGRDRQRLSKKEGSPAESYCVPTSDPQRMYALCMVDKESVKVLRQQVEQKVEGAQALWNYLTDVRTHFQPGLASKRKVVPSSGKAQAFDDEGVAFCSTNQCGADVPEKIVHPINYGYFSKTQPRQRFFLDTDSLAVTNQCIYLTLNKLSSHYDAEQCPPLLYFLTLLNSTTLQFFVLHHCQYDQQGRMRLFRESMAKIPFQDRDVKTHPERIGYVAQLGACMVELKDVLYSVVVAWRLTGSHHGSGIVHPPPPTIISGSTATSGRRGSTGGLASSGPFPAAGGSAGPSTGGGSNQGLLDWVRKGGNPPPGLLSRVKEQVRRMLVAQANHHHHQQHRQYLYQHQHQYQSPVIGMEGVAHVSKAAVTSSSAPSSSSAASILHLDKKSRDFKSGAMMMMSSGPVFTDTDTDTSTFTDTDTDTDDTMDPWVASRRTVSTSSTTGAARYLQQRQSQGGRTQGQHSLARILNMSGDDEDEVTMDEEEGSATITDSSQTMPMPIPEGSRDRRGLRPIMSSGFGHDEEDEEEEEGEEQDKSLGTIPLATTTLERAVTMVEIVQWAVDQYGYMLYGIRPKFQKLLELELKIVYGSRVESLIAPTTPPPPTASAMGEGGGFGEEVVVVEGGVPFRGGATENLASSLGITVWDLYRWEGEAGPIPPLLTPAPTSSSFSSTIASDRTTAGPRGSANSAAETETAGGGGGRQALLPSYAFQVLENAQSATQLLRDLFEQFPALPSTSSSSSL